MDQTEFSQIRRSLGKTQEQLARLLGTSLKAIQSFEQGWRNIPVHIERQVLFLLAMKRHRKKKNTPCWVTRTCPAKIRRNCPAWEFHGGQLCWFINGTICQGEVQKNWQDKMKICRQCEVFRPILLLS
jgi:DNA-binding XRE family transcriptional regulator